MTSTQEPPRRPRIVPSSSPAQHSISTSYRLPHQFLSSRDPAGANLQKGLGIRLLFFLNNPFATGRTIMLYLAGKDLQPQAVESVAPATTTSWELKHINFGRLPRTERFMG